LIEIGYLVNMMGEQPTSKRKPRTGTNPGRKRALGRGLDSLIPEPEPAQNGSSVYFLCDIDRIRPNPYQPRRQFREEELAELSRSIEEQGVIQPLLVRERGNIFELIAGERRLRASKMAGLQRVPVVVKTADDSELLALSIIENIQRENLNPIEEAEAYHRLIEEFRLTQDQTAARVGKSRSSVANILRLRQLPEQIKDSLVDGRLSMGHARAILSVGDGTSQLSVWREVIKKSLSVRQTEALVKHLGSGKRKPHKADPTTESRLLLDIADELSRTFGTKIEIKKRGAKGKINIEFYDDDDLDRLIGILRRA